jgi:5-methylcytosine-specific restriction endonuclease McrA
MTALFKPPFDNPARRNPRPTPSQQSQPPLADDSTWSAPNRWRPPPETDTRHYGRPDSSEPDAFNNTTTAPTGGASVQLAQFLPPAALFARPPLIDPRLLTPLEELPQGSAGGPSAGKLFPRRLNEQQPEGVPCIYCRTPTTKKPGPEQYNGDHNIPRSRGGNNQPTNRVPACRTCNRQKSDRTPSEWYEQMFRDLKS